MKILFCGDVVGRSGRDAIIKYIPQLRKELKLDFVVVNAENSAGGFGVNKKIFDSLISAGVDVVTGGDHIWDQKEVFSFINRSPRLLRPYNFPEATPGKGYGVFESENGKKILVVHLMGQIFMRFHLNTPFELVEKLLKDYKIGGNIDAIIVDIHAEATSEKMAMGKFLDGKVSMVVGSHTHVPTNDTMILPKGTAYQTDAGMCGDYNSVIGFYAESTIKTFLTKIKKDKYKPAMEKATLCGVYAELNNKGFAEKALPVKIDGQIGRTIEEIIEYAKA